MSQERIAELEREIVVADDHARACLSEHRHFFLERAQDLRAELSRLRNEQPSQEQVWLDRAKEQAPEIDKFEVEFFAELKRRDETPSPATTLGAQDVGEARVTEQGDDGCFCVCIETPGQVCEFHLGPSKHFADDLARAINEHAKLAALAQSHAQPVGWQVRQLPDGEWEPVEEKWAKSPIAGFAYRPLFTAPPRPDASARLIEAAEWLDRQALAHERNASDETDDEKPVMTEGDCSRAIAGYLRKAAHNIRTRAADRSAPRSDKGGA